MESRRRFLKQAAAAGMAAVVSADVLANTRPAPRKQAEGKKALFVYGGWDGHEPVGMRDRWVPWMKDVGFEVTVSDTLDAYLDDDLMQALDLVVQVFTMSQISADQERGLLTAVREGMGIAGWHGGLGDSFRNNTEYQFMVGGQWVAHPGGKINYRVQIVDHEDEITRGLADFDMPDTEQYYMHVDAANKVLATTTFTGEHAPWIDGAVCPVVWKKMYGKGRVFYNSLGHQVKDFDIPEAFEMTKRGILWAARSKEDGPEGLLRNAY